MNHEDALSRRSHLRAVQAATAKVTPDSIDYEALTLAATAFGVPPQFAPYVLKHFADRSADYKAIAKTLDQLLDPHREDYGLSISASKLPDASKVAAALFNGAVARGLSAYWVDFPDYATMNQKRVAMSTEAGEWDRGRIADWEIEMDSVRYCYDLVVVNAVHPKPATDFVDREFYTMLSNRMTRNLYTVVTFQRPKNDREATVFENRFADSLVPLIDDYYDNHRIEKGVSSNARK